MSDTPTEHEVDEATLTATLNEEGKAVDSADEEAAFNEAFKQEAGGDSGTVGEASAAKADIEAAAADDQPAQDTQASGGAPTAKGEEAGKGGDAGKPAAAGKAEPPDPVAKRMRDIDGRFGTLNRKFEELAAKVVASVTKQGDPTPTKQQVAEAAAAGKIEALKIDFPEWGEAIDAQMLALNMRMPDPEVLLKQAAEAGRTAYQEAVIEDKYEDWVQQIQTREFSDWLDAQDQQTQALADSKRGRDAIKLLDLYHGVAQDSGRGTEPVKPTAPDPKRRLESAVPATQGGGSNRQTRSPTEEEEFQASFKSVRGSG